MSPGIQIRGANAADVDALLTMIRELAIINAAEATITAPQLREDCFGERPWVQSIIAERAGKPVGYASWYLAYNASFGTRALNVHHLYVDSVHRKQGIGRCLIVALARAALEHGCNRIALAVIAENQDAMLFYEHLGFQREHPPNPRFFIIGNEIAEIAAIAPWDETPAAGPAATGD